jgi:hypothetical protein
VRREKHGKIESSSFGNTHNTRGGCDFENCAGTCVPDFERARFVAGTTQWHEHYFCSDFRCYLNHVQGGNEDFRKKSSPLPRGCDNAPKEEFTTCGGGL